MKQTVMEWMQHPEFIPAHLARWCDRYGGIDAPMRARMLAEYQSDPAYYDAAGGWPVVLRVCENNQ